MSTGARNPTCGLTDRERLIDQSVWLAAHRAVDGDAAKRRALLNLWANFLNDHSLNAIRQEFRRSLSPAPNSRLNSPSETERPT